MFSKTSIASLAALSSLVSGLALPATPVSRTASLTARDGATSTLSTSTDQCYWLSTYDGGVVSWAILLTRWDNFDQAKEEGDLKASIDHNGACRAYSAYSSMATGNDTLAVIFNTADSCTAWQMTQVLGKTNGKAHGTVNCNNWAAADGDPDISNLLTELPEDGDDGEDGFAKRALEAGQAKGKGKGQAKAAQVPQPDWADLKQKLKLPADASHDQVVKMLSGPSIFDELE